MTKTLRATRCALLLLALALLAQPAQGFDASFWVWTRETILSPRQQEQLRAGGVTALYWYAGSLRAEGGRWVPQDRLTMPSARMEGMTYVPVFRLTPGSENPLTSDAARELAVQMNALASSAGCAAVQIDFDCPDRQLRDYASFLQACRAALRPRQLSATALAGWSDTAAFRPLQGSVDALFPMFYDLQPDAPAEVRAGRVLPALDPVKAARQIDSWSSCRVPWQAGLPGFARVTIFDAQGRSRGHVRQWNWDAVAFQPGLGTLGQPAPGVTLLRAEKALTLMETPVAVGETIACRMPRREDLVKMLAAAKAAGASGAAIFRLPEGGASGGWSLAEWTALLGDGKPAEPLLRLTRSGAGLELTNASGADLPPRLAGPGGAQDRGWALEIEIPGAAVFREASPGDFAAVHGHAQPDAPQPLHVALPLAERLTYWLADLPAGARRRTGLLQLAPGADLARLRWRLPGSPHNGDWQALP